MIVGCPQCQTRFKLDEEKFTADIRLRCTKCRTIFRVERKSGGVAAPQAAAAKRPRVFVANENLAFCAAVQKVLSREPFDVFTFTDGLATLKAVEEMKPEVVMMDVALPSMYGFEVCEAIRKNPDLETVKVILIASIYDKTRYKRSPTSLYGADDYIEKHHIPDELAAKIYRLVAGQQDTGTIPEQTAQDEPVVSSEREKLSDQEKEVQVETRKELREMEETDTASVPSPAPPELPEAHQKAKRLARIIVSDIALYNQAKVEEGVRNGTFFDLIADDIREGRNLYLNRVPEDVRNETSYLEQAFEDLIAKKKKELNLS